MMAGENDDAASIREDSFLAGLVPQVAEHLAEQHAGDFDAEASRARFLAWLATHVKEPTADAKGLVARPRRRDRRDGPVISFNNVTKVYPNQAHPALDGVDLAIHEGEFVFLVGPSGSGKSTFLRLIMKEERPTEGRIHVVGKDLTPLPNWEVTRLRRRIGYVFRDFRLQPDKNVYQNVAFVLEVIGTPRRFIRRAVPEVIELVGLEGKHDRMPDELSGGEQQRLAIARAFVNRPVILLADEPTGNLDPATSIGILKLLDRINRTGTTVVMATHDATIVDSMRERVIKLEHGKVIRDRAAESERTT